MQPAARRLFRAAIHPCLASIHDRLKKIFFFWWNTPGQPSVVRRLNCCTCAKAMAALSEWYGISLKLTIITGFIGLKQCPTAGVDVGQQLGIYIEFFFVYTRQTATLVGTLFMWKLTGLKCVYLLGKVRTLFALEGYLSGYFSFLELLFEKNIYVWLWHVWHFNVVHGLEYRPDFLVTIIVGGKVRLLWKSAHFGSGRCLTGRDPDFARLVEW
jgi:hypothetical protein